MAGIHLHCRTRQSHQNRSPGPCGIRNSRSDIDLFVVTERKIDRSIFTKAGNLIGRETSVKSSTRTQFLKGLENGDPLAREVVSNHIVLKGIDELCDTMWRYYARK